MLFVSFSSRWVTNTNVFSGGIWSSSPYSTESRVPVGYSTPIKLTQTTGNLHGQHKPECEGTQCDLYSTCSRWGRVGWIGGRIGWIEASFLDTTMLVSATQKSRFGGIAQRKAPRGVVLRCSGI